MKNFSLLLTILAFQISYGQIQEHVYQPSSNGNSDVRDIIETNDGGFIITGTAKDTAGNDAMFLLKVDATFDTVWTRHYYNQNYNTQRGDRLLYNADGNLCVIGITNGPGVHLSFWEVDSNGDTVKTRNFYTGNNGITFDIPDVLITASGDYIVLVRNGTSSGSVHSFDSNWNLNWKKYGGSISAGWPSIDVNAQFVGVELRDTVLYYAARKASGADNKSFFVKSGVSGHFLGVKQYGVNAQNIRAEHLVINSNEQALLVGTMVTLIRPGFSSERTMILKTNLNGDSLGMTNDVSSTFPKHATIIDSEVILSGSIYTQSSGSRMAISVYNESGDSLGNQKLETLPNDWDQSQGSALKTLDRGNGKRLTLVSRGDRNGKGIVLLAYVQNLGMPPGDTGTTNTSVQNVYLGSPLEVYPNPVNEVLNIDGIEKSEIRVEVFDMKGMEVLKSPVQNKSVSVESLEPGIFIMRFYDVEGRFISMSRIIKQ